ncbi:MAG: hypothetical protein M0R22_11750 [Dehalococcoidia bacterium]|jgi:hypothetical protein|nr:hypothetical protein [Dehalococcoidia bacterium]
MGASESTGHTKASAEEIEKAARKILGLPRFPDGATGSRSAALLAQINADRGKLGDAAAMKMHAAHCTLFHASALDSDPAEYRAVSSARPLAAEKDGTYSCADSSVLRAALADPEARRKCTSAELAKLDAHVASAKPIEEPVAEEPKEPIK